MTNIPEDLPSDIETPAERQLADFTMSPDSLRLMLLAVVVGVVATGVAVLLLALIALVTNLFYHGTISIEAVPPDPRSLGLLSILVPVTGGLIIGLMARFGSERIRGHGIPEALETILVGGSRVEPRLAVLKPTSSAISIGTGGPFGAEGPIILTGGALGSLLSQFFRLSSAERKTLLVAGAAAGMTAVFATPVASVILAAELLLFEWKPRSLLPAAIACIVAATLRMGLAQAGALPPAPLFPVPAHPILGPEALLGSLAVGVIGGLLAWGLTAAVYSAEDAFKRLPIHWMWWPAIGGIVVGIGGLIDPRALGVGYASIAAELSGELALSSLVLLLVVKLTIWSVALGSGTSGGILAPLLIIGGAAGSIAGHWLPGADPATWALLGMAATMAGVMRSPLTAMVFAVELTHDQNALLPLLVGCMTAYGISVLVLRRSILTEKIARRGFHVSREYAVDPLEALLVRDVMATDVLVLPPDRPLEDLATLVTDRHRRRQPLYPVVDADGGLAGVVTRGDLAAWRPGEDQQRDAPPSDVPQTVAAIMRTPIVAHPDETLRLAVERMSLRRLGVLPVVDRGDGRRLVGLVSQFDVMRARDRLVTEERRRERVLRLRPVPMVRRARP